jgi:hypothetical protein
MYSKGKQGSCYFQIKGRNDFFFFKSDCEKWKTTERSEETSESSQLLNQNFALRPDSEVTVSKFNKYLNGTENN